jgi:hypothetical protein
MRGVMGKSTKEGTLVRQIMYEEEEAYERERL